eukprot:5117642-Amphidinium_carterae.1
MPSHCDAQLVPPLPQVLAESSGDSNCDIVYARVLCTKNVYATMLCKELNSSYALISIAAQIQVFTQS